MGNYVNQVHHTTIYINTAAMNLNLDIFFN